MGNEGWLRNAKPDHHPNVNPHIAIFHTGSNKGSDT
jgi:hypothetical protein